MKIKFPSSSLRSQHNQRGMALIASIIIMLLMTIVGLSIFRGNNMFEKSAANTRDKQRALQMAQAALVNAEWWLNNGTGVNPSGSACTAALTNAMRVCTTDATTSLATIYSLIPNMFSNYSPGGDYTLNTSGETAGSLAGSTSGGLTSSGDVYYSQTPYVYINCLNCGTTLAGGQFLFRITAIGYGGSGGNNGAVAVVQSVYALGSTAPSINTL